MNCDDFLEWMKARTRNNLKENPEERSHLESCPACQRIFALDACLEASIQQAFTPHRLPAGLAESIDDCLNQYGNVSQKREHSGHDALTSAKSFGPATRKTVS